MNNISDNGFRSSRERPIAVNSSVNFEPRSAVKLSSIKQSQLREMFSFAWNKSFFKSLSKKYSFEDKRRKRAEYSVLVIVSVLIALGTLTLYAIGPAVLKRTGGGLGRQTLFLMIGLVGMVGAYKFPKPALIIKWAPYLLALSIILCALILVPGIGKVVYGGRRWIELGPLGSMQPSELVKAGIVFFLSGIAIYFKQAKSDTNLQVSYLAVFGAVIGTFILISQRDLGTSLVISTIVLFILISAGTSKAVLSKLLILGVLMFAFSIMFFGYRRERLLSFLGKSNHSQVEGTESPAEYHLRQSLIAIGSGGIYGRGVGKSVQSFGYLPEAPSDSIFAVYAEKFGLLGSIALLTLFGVLIKRMLDIMNGLEGYWKNVVAGITGWIAGNFMVNMGSILGLIPFTGVPLPFFSLGGTNLVIMLTMIGVVLNLSAYKKSRMNVYSEVDV